MTQEHKLLLASLLLGMVLALTPFYLGFRTGTSIARAEVAMVRAEAQRQAALVDSLVSALGNGTLVRRPDGSIAWTAPRSGR